MAGLEWMVVRDLVETETAAFWYDSPEVASGELRTEEIETEVFFLPAAAHTEKDGSFTNTQRLLQWHHKAVEPPGDARSDLWFMVHLGRIIRERLAGSTDPMDEPVQRLTWDYPVVGETAEPVADAVLREINGWDAAGEPLSAYTELRDDGSTACGCWIYCGCYADGVNQAARRRPGDEQSWVAPEWGWAWPANRRILYNRASADPDGKPWSERKRYVWWDEAEGTWTGEDVPDFPPDKRPDYSPPDGARAEAAIAGDHPFIMQADGRGWLFTPAGVVDGPMPTHYEPDESPVPNPLYGQRANPARQRFERDGNRSNSDRYPFVMTTYRLTEHHTAGGMSRWIGYLSELQPEMFCEISPDLARERGLVNGGWATITSRRAAIEARVLVTERMQPLRVNGGYVHQVGLPYHWGSRGYARGDAANDLFEIVLDPNVHIQETKAGTCDIQPGRGKR
jgi:formate dehydrogenase major subunit